MHKRCDAVQFDRNRPTGRQRKWKDSLKTKCRCSSTLRTGFGLERTELLSSGLFWTGQGTVIYWSDVSNTESTDKTLSLSLSLSPTAEDNCVIFRRTAYPVTKPL